MGAIHCGKGPLSRVAALTVLALTATGAKAADPPFVGVSLSVDSPTIPAGGVLQMQVFVTEPNPILKGKQRASFSSAKAAAFSPFATPAAVLGNIRDAALYSPGGDVSGVAVGKTGSTQIYFSSSLTLFGTSIDTPVMTIALPVSKTAAAGQTVDLTLDPTNSLWFDPNSQLYPVELKSGVMTVGGTLSISDVSPGAGTIQPGTLISIRGTGFDPNAKVDINEAAIATSTYVSSTLMQVTLSVPLNIRGKRTRVTNDNNERAEYYPYQRTSAIGTSTHALIASSIPLFAETTWTTGYFRPTVQGTIFSGLAMQNLNSKKANVTLKVYSKKGVLLGTQSQILGVNKTQARDLTELFPGVTITTGMKVKVTSDRPIQMMGLLGDDAASTLLPIDPSPTP